MINYINGWLCSRQLRCARSLLFEQPASLVMGLVTPVARPERTNHNLKKSHRRHGKQLSLKKHRVEHFPSQLTVVMIPSFEAVTFLT